MIICDLAEFYNIYDYEKYEPLKLATYVIGLGGSSRLMKELAGVKYTEYEIIVARIADSLNWLVWSKTKDGERGINRPQSIVERMLGETKEEKQDFEHDVFNSVEEFKKAREKALR